MDHRFLVANDLFLDDGPATLQVRMSMGSANPGGCVPGRTRSRETALAAVVVEGLSRQGRGIDAGFVDGLGDRQHPEAMGEEAHGVGVLGAAAVAHADGDGDELPVHADEDLRVVRSRANGHPPQPMPR
ncbi:hypothetical protein [Methylorubrum sp. GM97]|uniref:hypothetical protein n=1 Tax=Methylorubrum sp. GM97 TaxID=2938232 RepID=UPI0021C29F35|nr:hypothetical protein [Methylorubrum sp. GM97]